MHAAREINIRRLVCSYGTPTLGSWNCGGMAPMAEVLPCKDIGSLGKTGREDNGVGSCPWCDRTAGVHSASDRSCLQESQRLWSKEAGGQRSWFMF